MQDVQFEEEKIPVSREEVRQHSFLEGFFVKLGVPVERYSNVISILSVVCIILAALAIFIIPKLFRAEERPVPVKYIKYKDEVTPQMRENMSQDFYDQLQSRY